MCRERRKAGDSLGFSEVWRPGPEREFALRSICGLSFAAWISRYGGSDHTLSCRGVSGKTRSRCDMVPWRTHSVFHVPASAGFLFAQTSNRGLAVARVFSNINGFFGVQKSSGCLSADTYVFT